MVSILLLMIQFLLQPVQFLFCFLFLQLDSLNLQQRLLSFQPLNLVVANQLLLHIIDIFLQLNKLLVIFLSVLISLFLKSNSVSWDISVKCFFNRLVILIWLGFNWLLRLFNSLMSHSLPWNRLNNLFLDLCSDYLNGLWRNILRDIHPLFLFLLHSLSLHLFSHLFGSFLILSLCILLSLLFIVLLLYPFALQFHVPPIFSLKF